MANKTFGMNPIDVKRDGGQLQTNAGDLLNEINLLVKHNSELKKIWKGGASESYFAKWDEKKQSVSKLQNWLQGFANATVKSADDVIKTDGDVSSSMR